MPEQERALAPLLTVWRAHSRRSRRSPLTSARTADSFAQTRGVSALIRGINLQRRNRIVPWVGAMEWLSKRGENQDGRE